MGKTNLGRVAFVPRGAYNNEVAYKRLDVAEHKGNSFLFLKDSTGIAPTGDGEITMLLAKRGKDFAYDDFTPEQLAALKGADGKDGVNGVDGKKGDKGDPGKGLSILGYYGTLDLLKAAITSPETGDAYGIGTAAPYDIYVFDGVTNDWVNNGKLSGGGESGGNVVLIPVAVLNLTSESTSAEILTAFGGKEAFIDAVTRAKNGALLALDINGSSSAVQYSLGLFVQEQNQYQLGFVYMNPLDTSNNIMILMQLTGDVATIEKSNHRYGYANIVNIPFGITTLNSASTSEQIISALGGRDSINAFVGKIMAGNAVVIMAGGDDSAASSYASVATLIQGYVDSDNFTLTIVFTSGTAGNEMTITVKNGVFSFSSNNPQALLRSDLVSDPSVGGTDKPASAEAVKKVNEEIIYKKLSVPRIEPEGWSVLLLYKSPVSRDEEDAFTKRIIGFFSGHDYRIDNFSIDIRGQLFYSDNSYSVFFDGTSECTIANTVRLVECTYNGEKYVAFEFNNNHNFYPIYEFIGNINEPVLFTVVRYKHYDETILNQEVNDSINPITGYFPKYNR